jgi:hypothetical protein
LLMRKEGCGEMKRVGVVGIPVNGKILDCHSQLWDTS